jgi:hypothetical protein
VNVGDDRDLHARPIPGRAARSPINTAAVEILLRGIIFILRTGALTE